ncbi:DUF4064 domain-containing protein [Gracilibacillus dipsosauri]|uniref:DUF4064 domain-containing protein n=1 Tax=Gracilibacillus dipsosauri TaxID=178340 RepID=A0A317L255_9BACI|nr:DUF4064 domain-containing protein [Gracilibacillus dipsosauri]PWU67869.1 hypothetical protein DLJ74_12205 [Gracilibacillus dipsosauri]
MKRGFERKLIMIGALWNLVTSLLTIFSYNSWFTSQGEKQLQNLDTNTMMAGSQMVNNVSKIIFIFGLFVLIGAIVNFLVATKIKDNEIQYKLIIWIGVWAILQILSMDVIGFVLYMLAFVLYMAKNKAIKLSAQKLQNA